MELIVLVKATASIDSKDHLFGIDLLRLFAVLLVVFDDLGAFSAARPEVGSPFAFPSVNVAARFGWVGVDIFFVISGFLIAISVRDESPFGFIKGRMARILPVLFMCSLISELALWTIGTPLRELLFSFFRSITLFPLGPYVDGTLWSLIVGTSFYFLIWVVLFARQVHNLEKVAAVLGIVSAIFLSIFVIALLKDGLQATNLFDVYERFIFKRLLLRPGVFLALGISLWLGYEYGFTKRRAFFCALWGIYGVIEIAIHAASENAKVVFTLAMTPVEAMILPVAVWVFAMVALIASVHFRAEISESLKSQKEVVKKLGLVAYPLYLNHYTLGAALVYRLISAHLARPLIFIIVFVVILSSSWLIMIGRSMRFRGGFVSF
jgi:peptidoglycan/LPS O-acetylase OafA/YrhL